MTEVHCCSPRLSWARFAPTVVAATLLAAALVGDANAATFSITRAEWEVDDGEGRLSLRGNGTAGLTVRISNAGSGVVLGTATVSNDNDEWRRRLTNPTPVPCRVRAEQLSSTGAVIGTLERDVSNRPANCGPVAGADTQAPTVSISSTAPAGPTYTSAQTVTINASAADNVGVARVEFYDGTTLIGSDTSSPYSFAWAITGASNGTHSLSARAFDAAGNSTSSAAVSRTVTIATADTQAPTVSISSTAPAGPTYTSAQTVTINATAADNVGVARVEFYDGTTLIGSDTSSPFSFAWAITGASNGTHSLSARAFDAAGNATSSAAASRTVNIAAPLPTACDPAVNGNHNGCFTNQLTGAREYTGPAQCVACHETQARNMHSSVHYQQNGPTDFVTNIAGNAGEGPADRPVLLPNQPALNVAFAINTYCGTHENSPRFTCAGCHVGNGRFPKTPTEMNALPRNDQLLELANIDCLMCHQEVYKRFPDWLTRNDNPLGTSEGFAPLELQNVTTDAAGNLVPAIGSTVIRTGFAGIPNVNSRTLDFQFRPAGAAGSVLPLPPGIPANFGAMALTTEAAAEGVRRTTRNTCLNCHANAGAADGAKRGDISSANRNSTDVNLDRHMANAAGGSNMTCSSCHNVDDTPTVNDTGRPSTHRVRGRGLDLRANDHATRFTCDSAGCHNAATVHNAVTNGSTFNTHSNKVACQTCHIPRYGKGVATEVSRDWQKPHVTQTACNGRGGWLPEEIKSSTATPPVPLTPTYQWFDGTSQVYYLKEALTNTPTKPLPADIATAFGMATGTPAYVLGRPNGGPGVAAAKIYPMKEHWGKLARNVSVNNPDVPVNSLVPQSTFEFFRTGSFCRAVATGLGQNPDTVCGTGVQNQSPPAGTAVVPVHTYQTLNHGVEPQAASLGAGNTCGSCHDVPISPFTTGKPLRMNLQRDMGYAVTRAGLTEGTNGNWSCSPSCHGNQTGNFTNIHSRSNHRNAGCNACHSAITGR